MTSTLDRAKSAYRLSRVRIAMMGALPSLAYVAASSTLGANETTFFVGALQLVVAGLFVFVGSPYSRGVGLGYVLGAIPFVTASVAQRAGHLCVDGACMSVCAPACTAAGLVTGVVGSLLTLRVHGGIRAFASMAAIVTLAGAMGCRCLGYGSVLGLVTGFVVASIPMMPRLLAESR